MMILCLSLASGLAVTVCAFVRWPSVITTHRNVLRWYVDLITVRSSCYILSWLLLLQAPQDRSLLLSWLLLLQAWFGCHGWKEFLLFTRLIKDTGVLQLLLNLSLSYN
jgi:hypothetical protein